MIHVPVMVREVLQHLLHDGSKLICDATVGCGGHARAILEAPLGRRASVIGIDQDPEALQEARENLREFGDRARLIRGNFADIGRLLSSRPVDGILADLGLSSLQLDRPARGFSYSAEGPLDMQMSREGRTAADVIDAASAADLAEILKNYGGVSRPMRIARSIRQSADAGSMRTTTDLRNAVGSALKGEAQPALLSKVFQAIRIAVNGELQCLGGFLDGVRGCMNADGVLIVISYHSLEDRMVKNFLKRESKGCICPPAMVVCTCEHDASLEIMTRRVVKPDAAEIERNPRARSAKLRAARFLPREAT